MQLAMAPVWSALSPWSLSLVAICFTVLLAADFAFNPNAGRFPTKNLVVGGVFQLLNSYVLAALAIQGSLLRNRNFRATGADLGALPFAAFARWWQLLGGHLRRAPSISKSSKCARYTSTCRKGRERLLRGTRACASRFRPTWLGPVVSDKKKSTSGDRCLLTDVVLRADELQNEKEQRRRRKISDDSCAVGELGHRFHLTPGL